MWDQHEHNDIIENLILQRFDYNPNNQISNNHFIYRKNKVLQHCYIQRFFLYTFMLQLLKIITENN